jgi:hypothetical protein
MVNRWHSEATTSSRRLRNLTFFGLRAAFHASPGRGPRRSKRGELRGWP